MVKMVTLTRAIAPWSKGSEVAIDDEDLADRLIAAGDATATPSVFDQVRRPAAPSPKKPKRPQGAPARPAGELDLRLAR